MADHKKGKILSVNKSFVLLETMMKNHFPMSLKELNAETGYPKSTIHDLLSTMIDHNVVMQDDSGKYYLGDKLFEYGQAVFSSWDIVQQMHEYLEELANLTDLNVALAAVREGYLVNVNYRIEKDSGIPDSSFVGVRKPFHASSQGKVFLAHFDEKKINRILKKEGLAAYTENTITDREMLFEELELVRKRGYAVGNAEFTENRRAVSVPVFSKENEVIFALAALGTVDQIADEEIPQLADILKKEALKVSAELGL